jgi:nucleoside-diphosphate-sugar epimerase
MVGGPPFLVGWSTPSLPDGRARGGGPPLKVLRRLGQPPGHIGSYLVPNLVAAGHEVIAISRGDRQPYLDHAAWGHVKVVHADREAGDQAGTFAEKVAAQKPDAVVDLICFTTSSAEQLIASLAPIKAYLLHCGTIWVHGPAVEVPVTEAAVRRPFGAYGAQKAAIEELLLAVARRGTLPCTVLHPGHIVGPGWPPLNPAGNFNLKVFELLAKGDELALPNLGLETVHHVHAEDVAQAFSKALLHPTLASGEAFHVVSERALTTPKRSTDGSTGLPASLSNPGKPGRQAGTRPTLRRRGTTSRTPPRRASTRLRGSLATSLVIRRWRVSSLRSTGWCRVARSMSAGVSRLPEHRRRTRLTNLARGPKPSGSQPSTAWTSAPMRPPGRAPKVSKDC